MITFALFSFLCLLLTDTYETVRSSLLHWSPLLALDNAVAELLYEETRRGLLQTRSLDIVLPAPSRPYHSSSLSPATRCSSSTSAPQKLGIQYRFKPPSHSAITADDIMNDSSSPAFSDSETGQTIGIDRKVGQLFELINLSIPHRPTIPLQSTASTASSNSLELWHSRLDRLVTKGFTQEYGIDYEETFAPVAHLTFVRNLLVIATVHEWPLFKMDVKNAFLNDDVIEEFHMQPPPGYSHPPNKVCRLRHALYGLKLAPCSGLDGISNLKQDLNHHFEMKDLGTLSYFLGLEVSTASNGKTASTPVERNVRFIPLDGTPLRDPTLFLTLVGSLLYLTVTHPDIAYVVHLEAERSALEIVGSEALTLRIQ
ncbi:hypothetical protein RJ639_040716 [Escallonia herrerae]|uniref:Reverse transcriptase Ty1/copia-type domain-containing protein n=1 Tax=Escallonia herrerae TaxID=1293975 RepID=A0AA88S1Z9_9ASTE|nr:hypothetical protein RJ639_026011 [Escallonia herrerae]KAK3025810.1 hypothetical protein RJ639_040716 [Escallonia herrerae]